MAAGLKLVEKESNVDRQKALEAALAQIDRAFGKGSAMRLGQKEAMQVEVISTGSLGHGLPVAAGMALAAKRAKADWRAFCILSDGELDEGSNWEAIQFAQHARLDSLVAIVDYNKIQSFGTVAEVSDLHPLADKFRAFNWGVHEIDGHDHAALLAALTAPPVLPTRPTVVICHTVKGKGVSFMEDKLAWHYKNPDDEQVIAALAELEQGA